MSGRSQFPPLSRKATPESAPSHCLQCRTPFAPEWPRSKWTLSGWSPWCPTCDARLAPHKPVKRKPGPKPKGGGWTNMPIS